ncbi:MAG TPA: TetR/AcrR family transcriptional regulator [Verrucomicrobiae bacterium]|nr:TetR/AcrR family transcriptional regulator [Verrucomicrobiae bacterium]
MRAGSTILQEERPIRVSPASSVRQRIIRDARRHFFANGFRGVTMDDLASELGMSKKTLYSHFSSKTALLEAVLMDKFRDAGADLERTTAAASSDFLMSLHGLLACLQRQMGEIQPPFVRDMRREAPDMFKLVETRRAEMIQRHFGKLLGRGRRAGVIRKDIPVNLIIETLLGAVQAIVNPLKMEELGMMPRDGLLTVIKIILEGAIARKGRKEA